MTPDLFFVELTQKKGIVRTLDFIYDTIDDWLLEGKEDEVNQVLERVNIDSCANTYLIGYLTITRGKSLTSRPQFFQQVKEKLQREGRALTLLRGLE